MSSLAARKCALSTVVLSLLAPSVSYSESTPHWRFFAGIPALHLGNVIPMGEYLGDYPSTWALGAVLGAERTAGARRWAGDVAVELLSPAGQYEPVVNRPVQARVGIGPVFALAKGRTTELRLSPRVGVIYAHYEFFGLVGPWGGLALDGLWWLTLRVAASVGFTGRAGYWRTVHKEFDSYDDEGALVAIEGLVGVVVAL